MRSVTTTKTHITKMTTFELKRDDFIALLGFQGINVGADDKVKVYVNIPRGGDYSGSELTIQESPIFVEVVSVTDEVSTDEQ